MMDIYDILAAMIRRWAISTPLLLVTGVVMWFAATAVGSDYTATGNLRLLPPVLVKQPAAGSIRHRVPWDDSSLADAAIVGLRNKVVHDQVAAAGYDGDWTVDVDIARTYVITVKTTAHTPAAAQRTTMHIMDMIRDEVHARQAPFTANPDDFVTAVAFNDGDDIQTETGRMKRTLLAVLAVGILLSAATAVAFDRHKRRRHRGPKTAE